MTSNSHTTAPLAGLILGILLAFGLLQANPGQAAEPVWAGSPQGHAVALTFDDGPSPYTREILALLKHHQARATFFIMGSHAERYPWLVRALVQGGNEVGNHSFSHPHLTKMDELSRERELERTELDLDLLAGPGSHDLFRPPYSDYDARLLAYVAHTHRRLVLWSVDSGDWRGLGADAIVTNVLTQVRPGAIIVFHDGDEGGRADRQPTVAALARIIPALQAAGHRLLTVSELLALSGPPPGP
jgi:peptidoglycan/xylan/chitin deacetylase (PgdA/CDA1 family)